MDIKISLQKMAEREGSEPSKQFPFTRFPSVRLQPSGLESLINFQFIFKTLKNWSSDDHMATNFN